MAEEGSPSIAFLLKYNTTQGFCAGENASHIYVISVLNHSTADDSFQIGPVSADDFISSASKFVNRAEALDLIGPKAGVWVGGQAGRLFHPCTREGFSETCQRMTRQAGT